MTISIPRHVVTAKLHESARTVVYRGYREADGLPVVFKCTKAEFPRAAEISRVRHEYAILSRVRGAPHVLEPLGIERCGHGLALILEAFEGEPLGHLIRAGRLSRRVLLEVGLAVTRALAALHRQHIVHKDVKPQNILVNLDRDDVALIDFGIATWLGRERQERAAPNDLEGSLAYMAPEQTGRMNRAIDHRADLYALGVTFYEALTGDVPFSTADPLDTIHGHIARVPSAPHEVTPGVPRVLSDIVMRLLAKTPDDRYQHAAGVAADLETCRERLTREGDIAPFPLGRSDVSEDIRIPQRLYGRDDERGELLAALGRVAAGSAEIFVLSGNAGVGKSALVGELARPVAASRGYFVSGKLDQLASSRPYAAIAQAFEELIEHVLAESEQARSAWRTRLLKALGTNTRIIASLAPNFEKLVGEQPAPEALGPSEAENRLRVAVQDFLRALTAEGKPIVFFLDDLQWTDPGSLKLLRHILTDSESRHLLVVGAYRDQAVHAGHPLTLALDDLRKAGASIHMLAVKPIAETHVAQFVGEALERDPERVAGLARTIFAKTHGNPFFVGQYLALLHREGFIEFDRRTGEWRWDLDAIQASAMTDSILDFMVQRLRRLPAESQAILPLAACIGTEFDVHTLATISNRELGEVVGALWNPLREELILPLDPEYRYLYANAGREGAAPLDLEAELNVRFRFLHDHARQAAYSLLDESERAEVHLHIGRLMLAAQRDAPEGATLFRIVDHLNAGLAVSTDRDERRQTAELNLRAGQRSKRAAAQEAAADYFRRGAQCLTETAWTDAHQLMASLHVERAESEFLIGHRDEANALFAVAMEHASGDRERAGILLLRSLLHTVSGDWAEAQRLGREGLRLFGVELPDVGELEEALAAELDRLPEHLAGRRIEDLADGPVMTDPDRILALSLLTSLFPSSFLTHRDLFFFVIVRHVNTSLQHGNAPDSIIGYVNLGYILAVLGRYEEGHAFGKLSLELTERLESLREQGAFGPSIVDVVQAHWYGAYCHFYEPPPLALSYLARARQHGFEVGAIQHLAFTTYCTFMLRFGRGDAMDAVSAQAVEFLALARRAQDQMSSLFLEVTCQVAKMFEGATIDRLSLSDDAFDEAAHEAMLTEAGLDTVASYMWTYKAQACFHYGEHERALDYAERAADHIGSGQGFFFTTELTLFRCLILAARYPSASEGDRKAYLARIGELRAQLDMWARHNPTIYEQKRLLVDAELARIEERELDAMNLYEEAVAKAIEHEFTRDEALASELAGRFHLAASRDRIARTYFASAYYAYTRWGVAPKVEALEAEFPYLRNESAGLAVAGESTRSTSASSSSAYSSAGGALDAKTVVDVASAVSGELVLDRLLERLMRILIENAGARRAYLLLERDGRLYTEGTISVDSDEVHVQMRQPLEQTEGLPRSIVEHVFRTREPVVLGNAALDLHFGRDPHIARGRVRSVSCVPMSHQGRLSGVLYLENALAEDAFTPARNELLRVLSSQAAVAVDNALLYADVQAATEKLRRANETLEDQVAARTRDLERAMAELWSEIDIAKKIQTVLLPTAPTMRGYQVAAVMRPASTVGGDYYDVVNLDGCDWVLVGDVSGHGVPAGLIMMMVQTAVRTTLKATDGDITPARLLSVVNKAVTPNLERIGKGQYMTISALRFEGERVDMAGLHEDLYVYRANAGSVERIETHGAWLGVLDDISDALSNDTFSLGAGDTLLLFSDGVTEARRGENFLGDEGLRGLFEELATAPSCASIVTGLEERLRDYDIRDDVTLLALRRGDLATGAA